MTTINSLRIQAEMISLEANLVSDVGALMRKAIPELASGLVSFFERFSPNDPAPALTSNQHGFIKQISKISYLNITALGATVPEGLKCSYLEYADKLSKAAAAVSDQNDGVIGILSRYTVFLSQLIANPDFKKTMMSNEVLYKNLQAKRDTLNQDLATCFQPGSYKTEARYGQVIARQSDWQRVFESSDNITKLICSVDRSTLNTKIKECAELLDVVLKKTKVNDFEGISPNALVNLSSGAYEIAKELEFFSAVYYKCMAYSESINQTVKHVRTVYPN